MSMCRWAPSSRARRSSGRRRSAASCSPSDGASGRSSGVSAETFTDTFTRGQRPDCRRARAPGVPASGWIDGRAARAPRGIAPRSVSASPAVTVASPSRSTVLADAALPQAPEHPDRLRGRLADDEPVGHVLDAGRRRGAERRARGAHVGDPHRRRQGRRDVRGPRRGSRGGGARRRPGSGTPGRRRRTGTARRGARDRAPRDPSPGHRAPVPDGARSTGRRRRAALRSGGSRARAQPRTPRRTAPPTGGVVLSISCHDIDATRRASSTAPAAAEAEQPLRVHEVDHDREVDRESDQLQHRHAIDDLINLERQQQRRRDERQVLGPPLREPQSDRLDPLEQGVREQRDPDHVQGVGAQREQLVELAEDADVAGGLHGTSGDAALERRKHPLEISLGGLLVGGEDQHDDPQQRQDHEVECPVEGDQPQHDPVAQRLAAGRDLDLSALGWVPARRLHRRRERDPAVAAQAPVPAAAVVFAYEYRILVADFSGVGADQDMALPAAHDKLPADPPPDARAGDVRAHETMLTARATTRITIHSEMQRLAAHQPLRGRGQRHRVRGAERRRVRERQIQVVREARLPVGRHVLLAVVGHLHEQEVRVIRRRRASSRPGRRGRSRSTRARTAARSCPTARSRRTSAPARSRVAVEQVVDEQDQREDVDGADQRDQSDRHVPAQRRVAHVLVRGEERPGRSAAAPPPRAAASSAERSASPGARTGATIAARDQSAEAPQNGDQRRAPRRAGRRSSCGVAGGASRVASSVIGGNGRTRAATASRGGGGSAPSRTPQHASDRRSCSRRASALAVAACGGSRSSSSARGDGHAGQDRHGHDAGNELDAYDDLADDHDPRGSADLPRGDAGALIPRQPRAPPVTGCSDSR